jgi:putative glutathione S-transferase
MLLLEKRLLVARTILAAMGMLVEGVWRDVPRDTKSTGGAFVRAESAFRDRVREPEAGRCHLYVSKSCPWAHRTLVVRALKGLEKAIPVFYADPYMAENGWEFSDGGIRYLHELYSKARSNYSGRVTVPVLWEASEARIVNNESSEIIRMLNRDFDALARRKLEDLYPEKLKKEIDWLNDRIYRTVNNGVYRAGFATAQDKYEEAVTELFRTLDWLEKRLSKRRWLCGKRFTEADVRLFTTLVRFDAVYYSHFKCNLRRLVDYPNLWRYTRRVYALPGVARTVDLAQIKSHYYRSMKHLNPTQIVPKGPVLDFRLP